MRTSRHSSFLVLLASVWCCVSLTGGWGQQTTPQSNSLTQLVKFGMIVTDESNQSVDNIKQEDIQVVDEGVPQRISLFVRDERPTQYVVAVDTSGSFRFLLEPSLRAVKALIENNKPDDQTMLVRFVSSDKIEWVQDFTADKSKLLDALKFFRPEGGQTAVIDALYVSAKSVVSYRLNDPNVRRAVVLISDGEDRTSYYSAQKLFKLLREQDVQVFIIGIVVQLYKEEGFIRPSPRQKAEKFLNQLAEETGGRVFFPNDVRDLQKATAEINHDLHLQFIVGFERQTAASEKGFRKMKVKMAPTSARKKLKLITRPGYWVNVQHPLPKDPDKKSR